MKATDPGFLLPSPLPAGVADALVASNRCRGGWIGVMTAGVDRSGRVTAVDLSRIEASEGCRRALEAMIRLSLARNRSISSPLVSHNVVLAKHEKAPLCLDPLPLSRERMPGRREEGEEAIVAPKVVRRVEPQFPEEMRRQMGRGARAQITVGATISATGCVRNVRLITQSPYGGINTAALLAVSQWTFEPGTMGGEPVDVEFNLTVAFSTR